MKKILIPLILLPLGVISLAAPVKSMLSAKEEAVVGGEWNPTAADYIQSGLLVQWDAIENVGYGIHDPDSAVWVDLCGNCPDVAVPASIFSWTESSLDFGKNYYATQTIAIPDGLYEALRSSLRRADITVEFVLADTGSNVSAMGISGMSPIGLLWTTYSDRLFYFAGGNIVFNPFGSGYGYYWNFIPVNAEERAYYGFTLNGHIDEYHIVSTVYYNDYGQIQTLPTNNANLYIWGDRVDSVYTDKAIVLFCNRNRLSMSVNAIRIYSRALSPAETDYNRKVDEVRFNLH